MWRVGVGRLQLEFDHSRIEEWSVDCSTLQPRRGYEGGSGDHLNPAADDESEWRSSSA